MTSHEHYTVILPCEISNLPSDMYVIWQYGRRGERNQTVLTIGSSQIIDNYRVRAIASAQDDAAVELVEDKVLGKDDELLSLSSNRRRQRISSVNLEIRKLQITDSGWYECQLPTKPTQVNYIYLEVLGAPKIEASVKSPRLGDSLELTCKVKNLPLNQELYWQYEDAKIETPNVITINDISLKSAPITTAPAASPTHHHHHHQNHETMIKHKKSHNSNATTNRRVMRKSKRNERPAMSSFRIELDRSDYENNVTISKLIIKNLDSNHRGHYKCRYESVEAKYHLEFKSKGALL